MFQSFKKRQSSCDIRCFRTIRETAADSNLGTMAAEPEEAVANVDTMAAEPEEAVAMYMRQNKCMKWKMLNDIFTWDQRLLE